MVDLDPDAHGLSQNRIKWSEQQGAKKQDNHQQDRHPNTDGHPHILVLHGQDIPKEDVEKVGGTFCDSNQDDS